MIIGRRRARTRIAGPIVLMLAAAAASAQPASPPPALFTAAAIPDNSLPLPRQARESRAVTIRLDVLAALGPKDKVQIDPFPALALTGVVDRLEHRSKSRYTVFGGLENDPDGSFIITVEEDAVAGIIQSPASDSLWRIDSRGNGIHAVSLIDPRTYGECSAAGDPAAAGPPAKAATAPAATVNDPVESGYALQAACTSGQPVFDMLIAYTTLARQAAGGASAMAAQCQLAVDTANQGFANSQIDARYRLVLRTEVSYNESGTFAEHLDRITDPNDGVLDNLHTLRNSYKADYVQLWMTDSDGGTLCGRANCDTDDAQAFSVMDWTCVTNFSSHHEIGHNMGCAHNRADAGSGCNLYSYSYGWRWYNAGGQGRRTIMAYDDSGNNYTRINYFSNPNVSFENKPTGVAVGSSNEADNAKTIRDNRSTYESNRISGFDVWVNFGYAGLEFGMFALPFNTVAEGHSAIVVSSSASEIPVLHVKAGTTTEKPTLSKPLILIPCGGTVRIGG